MREEQGLDYKGFIKTKRERWMFILSGAVKGFALWLYTTTVSVLWGEDGTEAGDPLGAYWNQDGVLDMQGGAGGGSVGLVMLREKLVSHHSTPNWSPHWFPQEIQLRQDCESWNITSICGTRRGSSRWGACTQLWKVPPPSHCPFQGPWCPPVTLLSMQFLGHTQSLPHGQHPQKVFFLLYKEPYLFSFTASNTINKAKRRWLCAKYRVPCGAVKSYQRSQTCLGRR